MSDFSPLSLVVEVPWPSAPIDGHSTVRYLPLADGILEDTFFPRRRERAPASVEDLAVRLLDPKREARTASDVEESQQDCVVPGGTLDTVPSLTGLAYAARFVAFRRGLNHATRLDAILALSRASTPGLSEAVERLSSAAGSMLASRRHEAAKALSSLDDTIVWLLAMFGQRIHASAMGRVIPSLATLISLHQGDVDVLTDAKGLTTHLLGRILTDQQIGSLLAEYRKPYPVTLAIGGTPVESLSAFVRRLFRATIVCDEALLESLMLQVLGDAGIASEPRDELFDPPVRQAAAPPAPARDSTSRAASGVAAITKLVPEHPTLVNLLVSKAALLGRGVEPSPTLFAGGSVEARLFVLRTLAAATDASLVIVDASDIHTLTQAQTVAKPADGRMSSGTIVVIEGFDTLRVTDDWDYDLQRAHRLSTQRALAHLLTHGVPAAPILTLWPRSPAWFVCGSDADADPASPFLRTGGSRGLIPALCNLLGDEVHLGDLSIALMVELLRPFYEACGDSASGSDAANTQVDMIKVPDATIVSAARLAHRGRSGVHGARRAIEAAARRAVMRVASGEPPTRIVITPDDLSRDDQRV
jgi:hypothetical protein